MPNSYTINLINNNVDKTFAFFQAQPEVNSSTLGGGDAKLPVGDDDVLSAVWVSQGCAGGGGGITIEAEVQFYAWDGTINSKAIVGVKVIGGKSLPAELGQNGTPGSTFISSEQKGIVDLKPGPKDTASAGAFEIDTSAFKTSANVLIGMSKPNTHTPGIYLPTAVINATGQMVYQIFPKNDYYVYVTETGVGEVFNYQAWSKYSGAISFSKNPGNFTATVTYSDDGSWSTVYSS